MRKKLFFLLSFIFCFLFALYLFRDAILFYAFQKLLAEKGISLKAQTLKVENGKIYFSGLSVRGKDFFLDAKEASFAFSLKERGLRVSLSNFSGGNFFAGEDKSSSLPVYLAKIYLDEGTWRIIGEKETFIRLKQAEIKGLGDFLRGFTTQKKLALNFPAQEKKQVSRERYNFEDLKEAISLALKVDFSKLPRWLKKEEIDTGLLQLKVATSFGPDHIAHFKGNAVIKNLGLGRYQNVFSGKTGFKGWWSPASYEFVLKGLGDFTPALRVSYKLSGNSQKEPYLTQIFAEITGSDAFFGEIASTFGAKAKGKIKASFSSEEPLKKADVQFSLNDFGFELSPDEIADGLSIKGKITLKFDKPLAFAGEVLLDNGEFYFAPWYYELKKPLALFFNANYQDKGLRFQEIKITGPLYAEINGLEVYPQLRLPEKSKVALKVEDFFKPLIVEAYGEEFPWLERLNLEGTLTLDQQKDTIKTDYTGNIVYQGHVFENVAINGAYSLSGKCNPFSLAWRKVKGQVIAAGPLFIQGKICPPSVFIAPFSLALLDGKISVGEGKGDLSTKSFVLNRVLLADIRPRLPAPYDFLKPEASGKFSKLFFKENRFLAHGELEVKIARGKVVFHDIFFEPGVLPKYGGNLEIKGLDLAILSKTFGLGRITGRLKGEVNNLVMVGTLPERFELRLEDDPSWQGKRRISLKAVRQMAELGGGSASIFVPFVKNLRYERLGFSCKLKNDFFHLKGLFHKDGKEYLIKGPRLFGVDVINQNPGGIISFKEMIRRIENILGGQNEGVR